MPVHITLFPSFILLQSQSRSKEKITTSFYLFLLCTTLSYFLISSAYRFPIHNYRRELLFFSFLSLSLLYTFISFWISLPQEDQYSHPGLFLSDFIPAVHFMRSILSPYIVFSSSSFLIIPNLVIFLFVSSISPDGFATTFFHVVFCHFPSRFFSISSPSVSCCFFITCSFSCSMLFFIFSFTCIHFVVFFGNVAFSFSSEVKYCKTFHGRWRVPLSFLYFFPSPSATILLSVPRLTPWLRFHAKAEVLKVKSIVCISSSCRLIFFFRSGILKV